MLYYYDMNKTTKKYIFSSIVTFVTGFAIAILPLLDNLTLESLKDGAVVGVIFAGVRAGIKALIEWAFVKPE